MEEGLSNAPCLYFSVTENGSLLDVNKQLCHQLGFTAAELIGQKQDLLFPVATRIFQQTHLFPLLSMQGHADEIYINLQIKEKEHLPVLANVERKEVEGKTVTIYVGIVVYNRKKFEDELVAARKTAEKALDENTALVEAKKELQEHAELLDRQISLSNKQNNELLQFNRVVTHDLQEPLRKLLIFTGSLLANAKDAKTAGTVHKIRSIAEEMRSLLSGLQQYAWLTEGIVKPVEVRLPLLLERLAEDTRKIHKGILIAIDADGLPAIFGDEQQLGFLFIELLQNAVRFRKPEGSCVIHVKALTLQQNNFRRISGKYHYSTYIRIELSDNGTGFDAQYVEQVFGLFKRLHPMSGRGIGLALCKKIVENHNGSIGIDSRVGEGTTVSILLPVLQSTDLPVEDGNRLLSHQTTSNGNEA